MNLIKSILFFLLWLCILPETKAQANTQTDSSAIFYRNIGYGWANPLDLALNFTDFRPEIYFDYAQMSSKGFYYRAGISFNYRRTTGSGLLPQNEWIPLNVTIGGEKYWHFSKTFVSLGADLFYSMSLRKARLGPFQTDDYGVGIAPLAGFGFLLREDLALYTQVEAGVGYFRKFVGVGNVTAQTLALQGILLRKISFGVRHFF